MRQDDTLQHNYTKDTEGEGYSLVIKLMNSDTHSCIHSFASLETCKIVQTFQWCHCVYMTIWGWHVLYSIKIWQVLYFGNLANSNTQHAAIARLLPYTRPPTIGGATCTCTINLYTQYLQPLLTLPIIS